MDKSHEHRFLRGEHGQNNAGVGNRETEMERVSFVSLNEMKDMIKQNMARLAGVCVDSEFAAEINDRVNNAGNFSMLLTILVRISLYGADMARIEANIKIAKKLCNQLVQACHINMNRDAIYYGCRDGMLSTTNRPVEEATVPHINDQNESQTNEEPDDNVEDILVDKITEIKEVIARIDKYDPTAAAKLRKMIKDL
jgi:hypothetical protein